MMEMSPDFSDNQKHRCCYETEMSSSHSIPFLTSEMSELPPMVHIHDAGADSFSLWAAGLRLLQRRTGCSTTYWELADPPAASALSFGTVGVIAVLGAGGPFGPLTQDTVFGHDTGLEGYWCSLLRAHAGHTRRQTKTTCRVIVRDGFCQF